MMRTAIEDLLNILSESSWSSVSIARTFIEAARRALSESHFDLIDDRLPDGPSLSEGSYQAYPACAAFQAAYYLVHGNNDRASRCLDTALSYIGRNPLYM